jgi:hypothetical protein
MNPENIRCDAYCNVFFPLNGRTSSKMSQSKLPSWGLGSYVISCTNIAQFKNFNNTLKGLSHDIDFDNVDKN